MPKTIVGKVVSVKMKDTIVVEVFHKKPHPIYRKLLKRSKKYKVAVNGQQVSLGDIVTIEETKPAAKGKNFKLVNSNEMKRKEEEHVTA